MGISPTPSGSGFPLFNNHGQSPACLVAAASASLRFGDLLHHYIRNHHHHHHHLGFDVLLRSTFKGFSNSGHLVGFKNYLHEGSCLFKGLNFVQLQKDAYAAACSSRLFFFGGKETKKVAGGEGRSNLGTPRRNSFDGRGWTNALLALNVMVFVADFAMQGKLITLGAKVNSLIDKGQFWRLATSSLLHANIGHLLVNCYSLNSVGPTVETITGPRRFLSVYFSSAIASSTVSYMFCKAPAVGASGAIFGLVGSFAVFVLRHRSIFGDKTQSLRHVAQVIALNMVIGVMSKGIDNWGHVGGLLGGAATAWLLGPAWTFESRTSDGRSVFVDRAPISYLTNRKRNSADG